MSEEHGSPTAERIGVDTVEALVRKQLATALGGRRGMLEAAVPGIIFTVLWLTTDDLRLALVCGLGVAAVALVARIVQRSSTQFVLNAVFGIAIGWVFVQWADSAGATDDEKKLAFFLPGILISLAYTVVLSFTCLIRWPMIGFMLGGVTGDPTAWHRDPQIVKLCTRLTWILLLPGAIGVLLQGPVYLMGRNDVLTTAQAVSLILVLRTGLGWVLRIGSWSAMLWLLARNATPIEQPAEE